MFWSMGIWSFDLNKAFRADSLFAASGRIEIWWIVQEANGALASILVQICFDGLPVDKRVLG